MIDATISKKDVNGLLDRTLVNDALGFVTIASLFDPYKSWVESQEIALGSCPRQTAQTSKDLAALVALRQQRPPLIRLK